MEGGQNSLSKLQRKTGSTLLWIRYKLPNAYTWYRRLGKRSPPNKTSSLTVKLLFVFVSNHPLTLLKLSKHLSPLNFLQKSEKRAIKSEPRACLPTEHAQKTCTTPLSMLNRLNTHTSQLLARGSLCTRREKKTLSIGKCNFSPHILYLWDIHLSLWYDVTMHRQMSGHVLLMSSITAKRQTNDPCDNLVWLAWLGQGVGGNTHTLRHTRMF